MLHLLSFASYLDPTLRQQLLSIWINLTCHLPTPDLTSLCDTSSLLPSLTSLLSNPSLPLDTTRDLLSLVLNLFGTSHELNLKLLSS